MIALTKAEKLESKLDKCLEMYRKSLDLELSDQTKNGWLRAADKLMRMLEIERNRYGKKY